MIEEIHERGMRALIAHARKGELRVVCGCGAIGGEKAKCEICRADDEPMQYGKAYTSNGVLVNCVECPQPTRCKKDGACEA